MSLLPLFSSWWEDLEQPHRLCNQHFGLGLTYDDFNRDLDNVLVLRPSRKRISYHPYEKAISRKSGTSTIKPAHKDNFQVILDVQQFAPEEVSVKVKERQVIVEGKHEEKQDEHGFISRNFVRKYLIPEQCDIDKVESSLSSDGVLTISCPKIQSIEDKTEKVIPIHQTGQPAIVHPGDVNTDTSAKESPKTPIKDLNKSSGPATRAQDKSKTVKAA